MARTSIEEECIEVARKAVAKQLGGRKNLSNRVRRGVLEGGRPKGNYEGEKGEVRGKAKERLSLNRSERLEMTRHGRKGRRKEGALDGKGVKQKSISN